MSLDENDGSDMELDSDTSPERYYGRNEIIVNYNQYSNSSNFSNTNENNDKKIFSTSYSNQSKNGSLQSPEFGIKSSVNPTMVSSNIHNIFPLQPPSPPFNFRELKPIPLSLPENNMNIYSSSSSQISNTLTLNLTSPKSPKQTNNFFLKSPMIKSPTNKNIIIEPTPLELKHDRIRFELKSTGYKNRSLSQIDKQSVNTSSKNIFNVNNNFDMMMNTHDKNLDKDFTFMNKPLSLFTKVSPNTFHNNNKSEKDKDSNFVNKPLSLFTKVSSNTFHNTKSEKVELECNDNSDKRVIDDDKFKEFIGNHVTEEKGSHQKQIFVESPLEMTEINPIEIKKDLNQREINNNNSFELIRENFVDIEKNPDQQQDQLVDNNFTDVNSKKNNEKQQEDQVIDDNFIVDVEKDQVNNNTLLVENSIILEKYQNQEKDQIDDYNYSKIQEEILDILQKERYGAKEIFQSMEVQLKNVDVVDEPLDYIQGSTGDDVITTIDRDMGIENDDNKSNEEDPSFSTIKTEEEEKSDIMDLDQVIIMSEQDNKNKDENTIFKTGIIKESETAPSEEMENEKKKDETINIQVTPKIKDKGKKVADIPVSKVVNNTNETVASSSKPIETDETSHSDHLTNLMTQFTNQINETSRQTNKYNNLESQSSQTQIQINDLATCQSTVHVTQPVKKIEETINANELSDEILEKYHKLDTILLEFDDVAKKAISAYDELVRLLPEGTVIRIDPPTTYKWDTITNMLGINDEKYKLSQDDNENKDENNSVEENVDIENEENVQEMGTSPETESDDEDLDIPSDDPDDKNFKCRSTILKQPNPKRWHNTRSNRPPSANLRQRTKVDPDSSNISNTPTTSNSSSKKKQSQTSSKRTLRTRKGEDEEDDNTISSSQKHLDLDKYYEDGRPRRPANGFSYFCGDMCAKVRNEKLPISGTIAYAAEVWKKMSDEEKKPWLVRGEKSKSEYQDLLIRWKEEQEELKNSGVKRTASPKAQSVFSYKKPRKDEQK